MARTQKAKEAYWRKLRQDIRELEHLGIISRAEFRSIIRRWAKLCRADGVDHFTLHS